MVSLKSSCDLMLPSQMFYNSFLIFWSIFQGIKFHESIESVKFEEYKYLEKTNYKVDKQHLHWL